MATIAIVEDDASQRRFLQALLQSRSHTVATFSDGREALAGIDERFALVLTDLLMPEMDGTTLCAELRKRFSKSQLPIIVISALNEEDGILEALDAGASDYMSKPVPPSLLHAKVKVHLEQAMRSASTRKDAVEATRFESEEAGSLPARYGHYVLEKTLGRGSYGVVYLARTSEEAPPVALKILDRSVGDNRQELTRYLREISTLSNLDCETVVRFVAAGHQGGHYYLAMEHVAGRSALELLRSSGALAPADVLRVGVDIAAALSAIHGEGLVHRDVKPANILIREDGHATLVDFGLAKPLRDASVSSSSELLGTVGYVAPEVIRGEEADPASDLYSLGVTLYELSSGRRAFTAANALEVLRRVSEGWTAEPLSHAVPGFPPGVSKIVAELMAFDRRDRPRDPGLVRARLAEFEGKLGRWR